MELGVYYRMRQIEDDHWWFKGRRDVVREVLASIPLPANSRILDVGCGTGGNLALLSEFGLTTGVEMNPVALAIARERRACPIVAGSLPDGMHVDGEYQLVTLFDVLEHVDDDFASLKTIAGKLATGGHVLITVPAFPFLWSGHDERHQHRRRYRKRQLTELLRQAGFCPVHVTYYNAWLFPLVAAARLAKRLLGREDSDDEMPSPWLNQLLSGVFRSERHFVTRTGFPFGVSLLAVARKA